MTDPIRFQDRSKKRGYDSTGLVVAFRDRSEKGGHDTGYLVAAALLVNRSTKR